MPDQKTVLEHMLSEAVHDDVKSIKQQLIEIIDELDDFLKLVRRAWDQYKPQESALLHVKKTNEVVRVTATTDVVVKLIESDIQTSDRELADLRKRLPRMGPGAMYEFISKLNKLIPAVRYLASEYREENN